MTFRIADRLRKTDQSLLLLSQDYSRNVAMATGISRPSAGLGSEVALGTCGVIEELCRKVRLWRRQNAELAHQAESIHDDAGVLDTAIIEAVDDTPQTRTGRPVAGIPRNSPL